NGMAPRDATVKAMDQVSGPVVAVALVLTAVFVPCAFITGITGQFFRQFALTIAVSTVISAFNSLTLSPALSALLLKPRTQGNPQALPGIAFLVLGACLGWLIAPWLSAELAALAPRFNLALPDYFAWLLLISAIALCAAAGWLLTNPLNYLLGLLFRA